MKKVSVLIALLVVFFAPLSYPLIFPYNPPLEAIDAYQTYHVTDTTYFGNLIKNIQSLKEEVPCTYTVLGWDKDDNLYYRSVCEDLSETYVYAPTAQTNNISQHIPEELSKDTYPDEQLLKMVRATGVRPQRHEPYTRPLNLMEGTVTISPTCSYIAFITKRIYSVQDIVMISQ